MQIIISPKAYLELADIKAYLLENFGEKTCDKRIDEIYKDIYMLSEDPFFGRHIVDGIRKINSGMSTILYEVEDEHIEIHHVVDSRTDWVKILDGQIGV
jgi:plasmid stabilization system protein ParE